MRDASRELLASRETVWGFLAEPNHLSDWWPGMVSVEPDRKGFAVGARWQVGVVSDPPRLGFVRMPRVGRARGPLTKQTLVITGIDPYERWAWELVSRLTARSERLATTRPVVVQLRAVDRERTKVEVHVGRDSPHDLRLAAAAVGRLYELVQTAAAL
jgi:uncharacterized protein YndB with AHSA1/START domain